MPEIGSVFQQVGQTHTAQRWDPEIGGGLYHYKARYYHPGLGRFLQPDPVGYGAGMNLYAYVKNDPLDHTDPNGLDPLDRQRRALGRGLNSMDWASNEIIKGFDDPMARSMYGLAVVGGAMQAIGEIAIPTVEGFIAGYKLGEAGLPLNVYRGLGVGEGAALSNGLKATDPAANISPAAHVAGAKPSQYISTSKSLQTATRHATYEGGNNGVVKIDLTKVNRNSIVDVSKGVGAPGSAVNRMSRMSQEVLIKGNVPAKAISSVE